MNGSPKSAGVRGGTWRSKQWDYRVGNFLAYSYPLSLATLQFLKSFFIRPACGRPLKEVQQRFHLKSVVLGV